MNSNEIREKFIKFFESKGHKHVPSSPLVTDDASVLFTTAGMQQFKPYYIGAKDPMADFGSRNTVSIQKCIRTSDIEEVGDERHLTFFEMLGNFSFGGPANDGTSYWKKEAIAYAHEFVTKEMGLKIDYVTVFEGEPGVPEDVESAEIWRSLDANIEVRKCGRADNFWGPTGEEGPCGPTTEIYAGGIEIWNLVFNEFYQNKDKTLRPLETKGIDTGMGLERLTMVVQKKENVFETDLFKQTIGWIYTCANNNLQRSEYLKRAERIIADHMRSAVFIINDGVFPGSNERESIPRRIIKNAYICSDTLNLIENSLEIIAGSIITQYSNAYPLLSVNRDSILETIKKEVRRLKDLDESSNSRLEKLFDSYMNQLGKSGLEVQIRSIADNSSYKISNPLISPNEAFVLYSTYGVPKDKIIKFIKQKNFFIDIDEFNELFNREFKKHKEVSKAGMEQKFKGGLAGHSDMEIKYHTATHLLHQALHDVLGDEVGQKGSNITPERLRFDFSFPRKLTDEEKTKVEEIVNEKIAEKLPVHKVVMPKAEAEATGARHFFGEKYPDEVSVYYIGDSLESAYSKEFCGGPHVENIGELGHFKIVKEEAVSAGVRRIKATLE